MIDALNYQQRATQHRPTDPASMAVEIRRLIGTGLRPRDTSVALRLDLSAVLAALQTASPAAPPSNVPRLGVQRGSVGDFNSPSSE